MKGFSGSTEGTMVSLTFSSCAEKPGENITAAAEGSHGLGGQGDE